MSQRHIHAHHILTWVTPPRTEAVRRALNTARDHTAEADYRFLEAWEVAGESSIAAALRAHQIRRANPLLAAELRAELRRGRPLTTAERGALAAICG